MKKAILYLCVLAFLCCTFAVVVCAAEPSSSDAFGEVTLITDSAKISARNDYGYADGEDACVVLQIPDTQTYVTYPMYYCFSVRNDGQYGIQPTPDFANLNEATGYNFSITSVIRLEIPNYFTAVSTNYTQTNQMANLKYIKFNENFIYIHSSAFSSLANLETVEFEESNNDEISFYISSRAFAYCSSLKSISLPSQVTDFGERCFEGSSLTTITFGSRLGNVGTAAFLDCKSLTTVNIPENNSITEIKHRAFDNCSSLVSLSNLTNVTTFGSASMRGCTSLIGVFGIENVTRIEAETFMNCSSLTGTYNFNSLTFLGSRAFNSAGNNEGCYIALNMPVVEKLGDYTGSDSNIFQNSKGIMEIYIGDRLNEIGINVFSNAPNLWRCEIKGVTSAFTVLTQYTFDNCTSLKAFSIPEGIEVIANRVFRNCKALTAVYLPSTLQRITSGDNDHATFKNCSSLYFVSEPFSYKTIEDIPSEPSIYYLPSGLTLLQSETFDNARLNDVIVVPQGVTSLTQGCTFEGCFSASGKPTVVFLGDMETVTVNSWGVQAIYFCNPADVDAASAGFNEKITAYYCYGEGNISHLKELSRFTEATCLLPKMTADYCFCGQFIPDTVKADGEALGHDLGNVYYMFTALTIKGYDCQNCQRCDHVEKIEHKKAILEELGYSIKLFNLENGASLENGYAVDLELLSKYEALNGVSVRFGLAFNAKEGFEFDGTLDSFATFYDVYEKENQRFGAFVYKINYSDNARLDSEIIIGVYVREKNDEGEEIAFVNAKDNIFESVSYSAIANK